MAEEAAAAEVAAPSETVEAEAEAPASGWTEGMSEESQGFVENKGWKNADQALESYRSLETAMRTPADQLLRLPKEGDSEAWGEVYNRMGRPEEPSGYKFEDNDVPDGGFGLRENLREWAHKAGLSQNQASAILEGYHERIVELGGEMESQKAEQRTADDLALRKEWGGAWEENVSAGRLFRQRFGIDGDMMDKLEDALGYRGVLELSASIGRGLGEHGMPNGAEDSGEGLTYGMTPGAAKAKIGDLTLDKDFMEQYLAGRPEAVARMTRLHSLAHPEVASSE
jgi:hypothetical protein